MELTYILLFFILGTYMGSFYTVVGLRLPKKEDFIFSRSRCDQCKHQLSLIEMVPILSYFLLKKKCRYCDSKISPLSTYIELFTGVLFAVSYYSFSFSYELLIALGIISMLMIIVVSDLTYLIIPNEVLVFFSIYFIIIQFLSLGLKNTIIHILTGLFLFILMYLIMILGNHAFKKESMGGGDVKLMFLFGLVLDPLLGALTIFLGSFFALPISLFLYFTNKEKIIPFGPFLVMALAFIYFTKIDSSMIINWFKF
ncbi:MAG: prepilin peptidase [bacterium]|nr:prepilin peptidase [bacterium]